MISLPPPLLPTAAPPATRPDLLRAGVCSLVLHGVVLGLVLLVHPVKPWQPPEEAPTLTVSLQPETSAAAQPASARPRLRPAASGPQPGGQVASPPAVAEPNAPATAEMPAPAAPITPTALTAAHSNPAPTATANQITPPRFDVAGLDNPEPTYPGQSIRNREEGRVVLRVQVTAQGEPDTVQLQEGSGFFRLDRAALQVLWRWRFQPARLGQQAIAGEVLVPITFKLSATLR